MSLLSIAPVSAGLLTRGLIMTAGLGTVSAMALTMLRFARKPDMVKARLFLNYPRFSRRFLLLILFALVAEAFTWLYTLSGGAPAASFESWSGFLQNQALTMAVAVAIGGAMLRLWRMVK